jgi:hypothetical protein
MKIPKDAKQLKFNAGTIEFLSKTGEVIGSCPADSINFSKLTFFSSVLCSCGSEMVTISNWNTGDEEDWSEAYLSIWEQPNQLPLPLWQRIKNAFNDLRGRIPGGSEVILYREHLLALREIVDNAIDKMDKAKEAKETK